MYLGWQKSSLSFSITAFGKTQINFSANPLFGIVVKADMNMDRLHTWAGEEGL